VNVDVAISGREELPAWIVYGAPVFTIVAALVVGAVALIALQFDPVAVYEAMFINTVTETFGLTNTFVRGVPLILAGLAVYLPLRGGLWNIGAEGQLYLGAVAGTLFVAAFLPGVIGLFQVISARRADERLVLTGFPRATLFASRFLTVVAASLLTAGISIAVLTTRTDVAALPAAFGTLVGVGVLYGLVGMLVGAVLPRELEGSLVLIFVADIDEALASGIVRTDAAVTKLLPLHYPHELFRAAVTGSEIARSDALAAGAYLLGLGVVTLAVYVSMTGEGGDS